MRPISREMARGKRMIWYGKSYPFFPEDLKGFVPEKAAFLFHYANHVLKIQSGKDSLWREFDGRNLFERERAGPYLPPGWAFFLKDGDSVFYNPNGSIFYHGDPLKARPVLVEQVKKQSVSLKNSLEDLQKRYAAFPEALLCFPQGGNFWVCRLEDLEWKGLEILDEKTWKSSLKDGAPESLPDVATLLFVASCRRFDNRNLPRPPAPREIPSTR
jgi:hypothetical protein